jgi:2-polyprenyl-6-hydroxyphenyl methylase/3-demethylubiquinone-9 3-methyltransferase
MRSSHDVTPSNTDEQYVWGFDQIQIDHRNPMAFTRLIYLERIMTMMNTVTSLLPVGSRVGDVGCAQGNLALLLGEAGYRVDAYDLNSRFLEYSKKKWTRGDVSWINENAFQIAERGCYDCVILGEILEHVAHPDQLLKEALSLLAPGGYIVATTPNGRYFRNPLPSYEEVIARGDAERLEAEQFGPGGEHHLFAYTIEEIRKHIPVGCELVSVGYLGSGLYNSHVQKILNSKVLGPMYKSLAARVVRVPLLDLRIGSTVMVVLKRHL